MQSITLTDLAKLSEGVDRVVNQYNICSVLLVT